MIYVNVTVMASALTRSMINYEVAIITLELWKKDSRYLLGAFLTRKEVLSAVFHAMKLISMSHSLAQLRLQC